MSQETRRTAFTLIELLTVMAIITLLIGILTPSLSAARNRATKTAIFAQLNAMSAGLEAFKNDEDEYPPSNAVLMSDDPITTPDPDMAAWEVGTAAEPLQGAHMLKDAMVGRDFLGYDPRKTNTNIGYDRWDPTNDRREPYVKVDGVSVTSGNELPEDGFGIIQPTSRTIPSETGDGSVELDVNVFRDKFGWPILYYRASPISNQNTPITQTSNAAPNVFFGDGVYDGLDNEVFTSYTDSRHRIADANMLLTGLLGTPPAPGLTLGIEALTNEFAEFIRSFRATTFDSINNPREIVWPRPVNVDTFILLSAGKDGNYGTLDDVANFNVLSKER